MRGEDFKGVVREHRTYVNAGRDARGPDWRDANGPDWPVGLSDVGDDSETHVAGGAIRGVR